MSTAAEHYERLLAAHYCWMAGDFEAKVRDQQALFQRLGISDGHGRKAADLGCGPGYQSIALARLGFQVTSLDFSQALLGELTARRGGLAIEVVQGDIRRAGDLLTPGLDIMVCMGDTLSHLESKADVTRLFADAARLLSPGGRLVLSFRNLTAELAGTDRIFMVRSDTDKVMTCFLEYLPETVMVHDLIHSRVNGAWSLQKSSYPKLRLGPDWVAGQLQQNGLTVDRHEIVSGFELFAASRS